MLENNDSVKNVDDIKRGKQIAYHIRNQITHSAVSAANLFSSIILAFFVIMMKYLDDNQEELNLKVPDLMRFDILSAILPDRIPIERLAEYLNYVQKHMGIEMTSESLYYSLEKSGLLIYPEYLRMLFEIIGKEDFNIGRSGYVAASTAIKLFSLFKQYLQTGAMNIPEDILKLMKKILDMKPGMECYDFTKNGPATLAALTYNTPCNITVQCHSHESEALNIMLLIVTCEPKSVKIGHSSIEWIPVDLGNIASKFDCVTALPPIYLDLSVKTAMEQAQGYGEKYVEWWPENPGCAQWIYARHLVHSLNTEGVGIIFFPLGVLSRMGSYEDIRRIFLDCNYIDGVIEFPAGVFARTNAKMAMIVIRKNRLEKNILMINLDSNEANRLISVKRNELNFEGIDEVYDIYANWKEVPGISRSVSVTEIKNNGSCFSPSAYVQDVMDLELLGGDTDFLVDAEERLHKEFLKQEEMYQCSLKNFLQLKRKWEDAE